MTREEPKGYWTKGITDDGADHGKKTNLFMIENADKDQDDRGKMKTLLYTWQPVHPFNVEIKDEPNKYMFLVDPHGISHLRLSAHHYNDGTSTRTLYEPHTSKIDDYGNLITPDPSDYISSICFFRFKHIIHGHFLPSRGPNDEPAITYYDFQGKPTSFKLDTTSPDVVIQPDGILTYDAETSGNLQHTHKMGTLAKEWHANNPTFPNLKDYDFSHVTPEDFKEIEKGKYVLSASPKP